MAGQSEEHTDLATTRAASIVEYLDAEGVDHTLIEHDRTTSAAAEARATGEPAHKVAKTIVLEDRGGYVLAVVPGDERLDLHKLRERLGATSSRRSRLELCPRSAPGSRSSRSSTRGCSTRTASSAPRAITAIR